MASVPEARRIRIARFRLRHLARVLQIEAASFHEEAYDATLFREYFRICGDLFLVALDGAEVVGYSIACVQIGAAELISIAVDPAARHRGAALRLMRLTLAKLRRQGISEWWLMVEPSNERAQRFYRRFGFRRVRRVKSYYREGVDGLRMRMRLSGVD